MSSNMIAKASSVTEMRDIAARICRDYLTGAWKTISAEELQLRRISGGLSNFLYYVSLPERHYKSTNGTPRGSFSSSTSASKRARKDSFTSMLEPKEVLLRIYGQTHGEHALETMLTESVVFTLLSERKLGPKLHGIFPGGRIEQYIPARALLTSELSDPKISLKVAEKMAAIHSMDIPVSKEPDWMWSRMNRWVKSIDSTIEAAEKDRANGNKPTDDYEIFTQLDLPAEVEWLRSVIESENHPVVFSHNDLQEGNILLREDYTAPSSFCHLDNFDDSAQLDSHFSGILISKGGGDISSHKNSRKRSLDDSMENDLDNTRDSLLSGNSQGLSDHQLADGEPELMIIDFEYCAYNYRGFDLANHFLEWTFDYTNTEAPYFHHKLDQYPTIEQQDKFIATYLGKLANIDNEDDEDDVPDGNVTDNDDECYTPDPEEIEQVRREVQCFTMASHLFWSLWAIVNMYQEIEFGYMEYAACRLKQYIRAKKHYTALLNAAGNNTTVLVDPEK